MQNPDLHGLKWPTMMKSSQSNYTVSNLSRTTDDFVSLIKPEKSTKNNYRNQEKIEQLPTPTRHFSIANHLLQSIDTSQRYLRNFASDVNNNNGRTVSFDFNNNHIQHAKNEHNSVCRFKSHKQAQAPRMNGSVSFCQIDEELEQHISHQLNVKQASSNGFSQPSRFHMRNGNGESHFSSNTNGSFSSTTNKNKKSQNGFYASANGSRSSHYLNNTS